MPLNAELPARDEKSRRGGRTVPFALVLGRDWGGRLLVWLALSGAASLLERTPVPRAPHYTEEPLQRQDQTGDRL